MNGFTALLASLVAICQPATVQADRVEYNTVVRTNQFNGVVNESLHQTIWWRDGHVLDWTWGHDTPKPIQGKQWVWRPDGRIVEVHVRRCDETRTPFDPEVEDRAKLSGERRLNFLRR